MRNRSLPAAGAAMILTLAGFGLAGTASAAPGNGANSGGIYDSTCTDNTNYPNSANACDPSLNGEKTNAHRPLAGSVGNADNKNPPGQRADAPVDDVSADPNQGYECENGKNTGIGNGNPAHSGCVVPR